MGKIDLQVPLLAEDVESQINGKISHVNENYVALPAPASSELATSPSGSSRRLSCWAGLSIAACSVAAVLLLSAAFLPYDGLQNGKAVIYGTGNVEDLSEFYRTSRSSYHFQPSANWMNDPNAPMFYKGYYHLFYQYNPDGAVWGLIYWGHAVSTDLIHWQYLDLALEPDQWYDDAGVWSGSATILEDGTPVIFYTGARTIASSEADQSQNMAVPEDPSDPLLRKWRKVTVNPILFNPDGIASNDFRDPTTAWLENDGLWRLVVGAKKDNADGSVDGISLLYKSADFKKWELTGEYLHEVAGTGMWECVDFYPVAVEGHVGLNHSILRAENSILRAENYVDSFKYVLKASLDETRHDHYAIGTYSLQTHTFTVDNPAEDIGVGPRYDYGKFYASKTFFDTATSRRILWGWVNESDSETDDITKGWASVMAIPRTVWLDGKSSAHLLQWPVKELDVLRGAKTSLENIEMQPTDVVKVQGGDGSQLDIEVVFEKPDLDAFAEAASDAIEFDCSQGGSAHRGVLGPFGLLVLTDDHLTEQTAIFFYMTVKDGQWVTKVCSDQSRSSLAPGIDKTVYGSYVTVLPSEDTLSMRVLVDHSIVETFVQGGRLAITSRVYPTVAIDSGSHLFIFNNGTTPIQVKSLDVYEMGKVSMNFI